jgi:hypothetical protein
MSTYFEDWKTCLACVRGGTELQRLDVDDALLIQSEGTNYIIPNISFATNITIIVTQRHRVLNSLQYTFTEA